MLTPGEEVYLSAKVRNNGIRLGTAYLRFLLIDSYPPNGILFDSHGDLVPPASRAFRVTDLAVGESRPVTCPWRIPTPFAGSVHADLVVEVWNPHLLFGGPRPTCFYRSPRVGGFEIVNPAAKHTPTVFISYAWSDDRHDQWIIELVDELRKHGIESIVDKHAVRAGDELTHFMEAGMSGTNVVLLVCSRVYTTKANNRSSGGVGFETIVGSHEYAQRKAEDRARFIPIVRDNDLPGGKKLPTYLGSARYVDMEGPDWRGEPMRDLVASIQRQP